MGCRGSSLGRATRRPAEGHRGRALSQTWCQPHPYPCFLNRQNLHMISPHFSGKETEAQGAGLWVGSLAPSWAPILFLWAAVGEPGGLGGAGEPGP